MACSVEYHDDGTDGQGYAVGTTSPSDLIPSNYYVNQSEDHVSSFSYVPDAARAYDSYRYLGPTAREVHEAGNSGAPPAHLQKTTAKYEKSPSGDLLPTSDSIDELLSFHDEAGRHNRMDTQIHIENLDIQAQLHGMFFANEASELNPTSRVLCCYRRNLFQISGTVNIPNSQINLPREDGSQSQVSELTVHLSATESLNGDAVRLVIVPWKTPPPDAPFVANGPAEKELEDISLQLVSSGGEDSLLVPGLEDSVENSEYPAGSFIKCPISYKRLQFRIATANNGRRTGLQQYFTLHLTVVASTENGDSFNVGTKSSVPLVVRGRSPLNFQLRKKLTPVPKVRPPQIRSISDPDILAAREALEDLIKATRRSQEHGLGPSFGKQDGEHFTAQFPSRIVSDRWPGLASLMKWGHNTLRRLSRPKLDRHQRRIEWTCGCGVELYADFNSHQHEYVNELAAILQRPVDPSKGRNESVGTISTQTTASRTPSGEAIVKCSTQVPSSLGISKTLTKSISSTSGTPDSENPKSQYLELCINTGEYAKTLAEIDLFQIACDGDLFKKIRSEYTRLRSSRSRYWLIRPSGVHFVRFSVEDTLSVGILQKPLAIPPPCEVEAKKYSYSPCPLEEDPPIPQDIFLHYLSCTAYNPKTAWLPRLPKKLDLSILRFAGAVNYGWGVHINEGPNYFALGLVNIAMMIMSGLAAFLWKYFMNDFQGAFGFAGWIVAVVNGVLVAYIAKWQQV